jgi:hypothetical protein
MNLGMIAKSLTQGNRNNGSPLGGHYSVCVTRLIAHCPLLLFYRGGCCFYLGGGCRPEGPEARKFRSREGPQVRSPVRSTGPSAYKFDGP